MARAGAKAIQLNAYYIPEVDQTSQNLEQRYVEMVRTVRAAVDVPIAVKIAPYFSSMGDMARRLVDAGANGLVLFNRLYQPDFDLETQEVKTTLELSGSSEIRLSLLWIANLYGQMECSFAGTTGVHRGTDALKYILAGADVAMTTSALLKNGTGHLLVMLAEMIDWCDRHHCASIDQIRGAMSKRHVLDPSAFDRANYVKVLQSYMPKYATPGRFKRYEDFGL
jgi:dihydroorotate dehydrogenase (fumarate)